MTQADANIAKGIGVGQTGGGARALGDAVVVGPPVVVQPPTIGPSTSSPQITGFTPASGKVGTSVTITFSVAVAVEGVTFNGVSAEYSGSGTTINAIVPSGATSGPIGVVIPTETLGSSQSFSVVSAATPVIQNIGPDEAAVGASIIINGLNFKNPSQNPNEVQTVTFTGTSGVVPASHTDVSPTQINSTVPAGALTGVVVVINDGGVSNPFPFTVDPTVASFAPAATPVQTNVTLDGTALSSVTAVQFNGVSGTIVSKTYDAIVATVPTLTIPLPAVVSVQVLANGTAFQAKQTLTVTRSPPTISGFMPMGGVAGTEVTITGTHLDGVTVVKFNGVPQKTIDSSTSHQIMVKAPVGFTTGSIEVDTPTGVGSNVFTATSSQKFTLVVPPVVTGLSPTSGGSGIKVTISGHHLKFVTQVQFTGAKIIPEVADLTPETVTNQQITVKVPSDAKTGPITVTNAAGSAMTPVFTVPGT